MKKNVYATFLALFIILLSCREEKYSNNYEMLKLDTGNFAKIYNSNGNRKVINDVFKDLGRYDLIKNNTNIGRESETIANSEVLDLIFHNNLLQINDYVVWYNESVNSYRFINVNDFNNDNGELLMSDTNSPLVKEIFFNKNGEIENNSSTTTPNGKIKWGACSYCALGVVGVSMGFPGGLLELVACVDCVYHL